MEQPNITYRADGSLASLTGREAVELMRVATIITGLNMYVRTGGKMQLTRTATITNLLKMAGSYTNITYKRKEAAKAAADLKVWLELAKSTIPTTVEN